MREKIQFKLIAIYVLFWLFWLLYSYVAGYPLELYTVFAIIISFGGFLIGRGITKKRVSSEVVTFSSREKITKFLRLVTIVNCFLLVFALISIIRNGFEHRYLMFTDEGLFDNIWITFLISYIIQPLTYIAIVISVVAREDCSRNAIYTYSLLVMMSILTLGRFPIYYIIYFYLVNQILSVDKLNGLTRFAKVTSVLALIVFSSWALLKSKLADEMSAVVDFSEILTTYVLNYHIVGYHMLDYVISSGSPDVMAYAYPTTSLGFFGWILHLLTKYSILLPVFPNSFMDLMETFNGGIYLEKLQWSYNAFTTSILPLYVDGGLIGIFFGFLIYGAISTSGRNLDCYRIRPMLLLVVFMLTFSLFQPFINSSLPMCALFLWLFNKYLLRRTKFILGR